MSYASSLSTLNDGRHDQHHTFRLAEALALSLLVHLLVLLLFRGAPVLNRSEAIEVQFLAPERKSAVKPPQIVSPSEAPEQKPPEETNLRAEKDSRAEQETIRRGLPRTQSQPVTVEQQVNKPQQPQKPSNTKRAESAPAKSANVAKTSTTKDPSPSPKTLRLSGGEILAAIGANTTTNQTVPEQRPKAETEPARKQDAPPLSDEARERKLEQYQPFGRITLPELFTGKTGTADFLPTVQDGEVTLLNAKADRFAVFVRRVALQVFGALRKQSWSEVSHDRLQEARSFVTVYATMSPKGVLKRVSVQDQSGSVLFDRVVESAVKKGAWDQNPPAEAAGADGDIRFVFKSRTWSRRAGESRSEQRWLLLATGLL